MARKAGRLGVALRALDHAWARGAQDEALRAGLGREAHALGAALVDQGACVAALGLLLRARSLGEARAQPALAALARDYPRWRPAPESVGAVRDSLKAAASGTFSLGQAGDGRLLTLEGQITGENKHDFSRVLEVSAEGVDWLLVDMHALTYVGSTGMAAVVKEAEGLSSRGGGISLFSLSSSLKILVEMLGVAQFLNPKVSLLDAIDRASKGRG
ncbi:MAG: STAS domain-containing protein [Planctomycetes bacterium]|nr:STAS domain-containing protein [Planctomycetota bacterium]